MADSLTIRKVGNSHGVILPKAELERLGVGEGDKLYVVHTPGGIRLVPHDPDFANVMEATRDFMRRHRDTLRELAK